MSALTTLGAIADGLALIDFFRGNIPGEAPDMGTMVQIKAGRQLVGEEPDNLGGQISAVYGYNGDNEFIGQSSNAFVGEADAVTFTIDQTSPGEQARFVGVSARADAICISWISVAFRDNTGGGAWTGDVGKFCGQRWTWGREVAGKIPDTDDDYVPNCTWLDNDLMDGTVSAALKFRTDAYGNEAADTFNSGRACSSTIFGRDEAPIAGRPAKREVPVRPQWVADELVVSSIPGQTAEELCNSETSWGQDFIGVDGKYCDMSTKQLLPLCSTEEVDDCVEISEQDSSIVRHNNVARREIKSAHRHYKLVSHTSV